MQQKRWYICNNYVKRWSTMTLFRNRMFLEGIAIGGICGIIIGSVIAFTLGESSMEAARSVMNKLFSVSRQVPFEYLSQ